MIVPVELVLPVIPLTAGVFDTQVLKHVMLAGPIVKLVLLLLVGFSVVSWAIIFLKFRLFKGIERNQAGFALAFAEGKSLTALYEQAEKGEKSPLTEVYRAGYLELTRIQRERGEAPQGGRTAPFPVENVYRAMNRTTHEQVDGMENLLPFLATTGSATPFIGLFGTVVGHHERLLRHRHHGKRDAGHRGPRHRRGPRRHRGRTGRGHPVGHGVQLLPDAASGRSTPGSNSFTSEFINFLERKIEKG